MRRLNRKIVVLLMLTMYNIECASTGSNFRCKPGC